jgi:hypothetical protein
LSIASKNEVNESPAASGGCTLLRLCAGHPEHDRQRRRRLTK